MQRILAQISIKDVAELELRLDKAVRTAIDAALPESLHGVLVTRHDHYNLTVSISSEVPYGITREIDRRR